MPARGTGPAACRNAAVIAATDAFASLLPEAVDACRPRPRGSCGGIVQPGLGVDRVEVRVQSRGSGPCSPATA